MAQLPPTSANGAGRLPPVDALVAGILAGDRSMLARAITLIESTRSDHRSLARDLLQRLLPHTGRAHRIGITGSPGAGKSTTIDQLGCNLTAAGHRVAVLAVDPSSALTGGSILGDKTRMERLANDPHAFVRPSPSAGTLGGVTRRTREVMALCEAAGFDVVIVETVGVGQSETAVAGMVDCFVVLLTPGAGDELQGIKKGLIELADVLAINKSDGERLPAARRTAGDYRAALHILTPPGSPWQPPVMLISGLENIGLDELWRQIETHRAGMLASGEHAGRRQRQAVAWMHELIDDRLRASLLGNPRVAGRMPALEAEVAAGRLAAQVAADEVAELAGIAAEPPRRDPTAPPS